MPYRTEKSDQENKLMKKILAVILCLCMFASLFTVSAMAEGIEGTEGNTENPGTVQTPNGNSEEPGSTENTEGQPVPLNSGEETHTAEEVIEHNAEEDAKVEANKIALEKQEKREELMQEHEAKTDGMEKTTDADSAPDSWDTTTDEPKTIIVEDAEDKSGETVKATNIHIYVDEDYPGYYEGTEIDQNGFEISEDTTLGHLVKCEWETVEVDKNDKVTTVSEGDIYGGSVFRRLIEGYTNGYWIPTNEFGSNAVNYEFSWQNGPANTVSYDEGTTDNKAPVNIFSLFIYSFLRLGPEPEKVEEYVPDYWEMPSPPPAPMPDPDSALPVAPDPDPDPDPEPDPAPEVTKEVQLPEAPAEEPVEEIEDEETPLASDGARAWALVNLILTILTIIAVIAAKNGRSRLLGAAVGLLSVVVFILTEDMRNPMVMVDKWTIWMAVIALAQLAVVIFSKKEEKEETEAPAT